MGRGATVLYGRSPSPGCLVGDEDGVVVETG
jgi:hypothetical protein